MVRIGWFPGRRVDLTDDLQEWEESGYTAPDAVMKFMVECGGLEFEYPRHSAVGGLYSCVISGSITSQRIPRALVSGCEGRLGCGLCPIGQSASGNLFLLMAPDGSVYGVRDRFLAKISDDGYQALHAIWKRAKLIPL
ncbi:SUKH-3 domain-containing protein [Streptomyces sp. NPDC002666]